MQMGKFADKRILVLGAGASGLAAAFLAKAHGASVTLLDSGRPPQEAVDSLRDGGICVRTGDDALSAPGRFDLAIYSPGIPSGSPLDMLAAGCSAARVGELAFGASFLKCPVLAVTGTNGKTTTVEMLEHCLRGAGIDAVAAGNIGLPVSRIAAEGHSHEMAVLEVSSFQLEHPGDFSPMAAALLNITPDHLSRHGSMEGYTAAKLEIFRNPDTICAVNTATAQIKQVRDALLGHAHVLEFSSEDSRAPFRVQGGSLVHEREDGILELAKISELPFAGRHNLSNALATAALVFAAGLDERAVMGHLATFRTGPHRLQKVGSLGGLVFVDDSKATNVDALVKALDSIGSDGPVALIAGGVDKACTLDEAIPSLKGRVEAAFLIGSCAARLAESWRRGTATFRCGSMKEAVYRAADFLRGRGTVLLSPACASQDMYSDYAERGDDFAKAALNYIEEH